MKRALRGLAALSLVALACSTTTRPERTLDASGAAGTGSAGTTGAAGQAAAGTTGAAGQAAAGATGAAGTGSAGTTGAAGTTGSAGTTGAAGAGDAGVADASDGGGHGACAATLCESFAGVAPGATGSPWKIDVDTKGTVVEVVSDKGRSDSHSLHLKVSAMGGIRGYVTETSTLASTGASFWGRAFIWYAVDTPNVHIVNAAVDGKTNGTDEQVRMVNVIGNHVCTNRRSDDMGKCSNVTPPQGKWSCYEWHLTPTSLDVYLDGADLKISEAWTEPTISLVRVGFERFTAGASGDLWLDDLAIGPTRIGCD